MSKIVNEIRQKLKDNVDLHTKEVGKSFFKEEVKPYGVKTSVVTKIVKDYDKVLLTMPKEEVFSLCEELWNSGMMEEGFIAAHFAYIIHRSYTPDDFQVFEKWVDTYVSNWAACDTLCNHAVGVFVGMYPSYIKNLKKWALSPNRWVRRAAAVTLILPARKGKFLSDIFAIADTMLLDQDDLVQKGYGWMLKAASEAHQKEVFDYVMSKKKEMPRTAFRYAIEKMPAELRAKAMEKTVKQ